MNPLYLLDDRVNLVNLDGREDFVIVKKNFDLVGTAVDLGFANNDKELFDEGFYSVPIINKGYSNGDKQKAALFCEGYHQRDGRFNRFLVDSGLRKPWLIEATGEKNTHFKKYGMINSEEIAVRVPDFDLRFSELERSLNHAAAL